MRENVGKKTHNKLIFKTKHGHEDDLLKLTRFSLLSLFAV